MAINFTDEQLEALRADVTGKMSQKRGVHTLEVEKMAARLSALYCPQKESILRAAALLHDITKEYKTEMQIMLSAEYEIEISRDDLYAPKTFHARTAAAMIPDKYPEFSDGEIISAVRWHTTGRAGMTLSEKLIYLADYIDMSRTFFDCVALRNYFFDAEPEKMSECERLVHLDRTLVLSFDMTIKGLLKEERIINRDTINARNSLICALS